MSRRALSSRGKVYVADQFNDRIQVFEQVSFIAMNKAIVVAGAGPFSGNNLWDAMQMCRQPSRRALWTR